jgi:glucan-binding YG repeat protein
MKKQTKLVAVASAAALLAIGASMTSFAAAGWVEEDGTWYYYDKDGNKVEDEWKKSGDNWYWLDGDEGGAMAVDKLIEDDDNTYYVDSNGVMVKNVWVKVVNDDQDEDDDPAEYHYYYMQSNGKAYKAPTSGNTTFKTIDGKRYAFDDDGKMLYGWVNDNSERESDDNGWEDATYYLGSWDDGAMKTGWQKINVHDDSSDKDEDDYDYWFNFKSNGKKRVHTSESSTWKSGNKRYHFDSRGVMVYEWFLASSDTASASSPSAWRYFGSVEDGARVTKGWFKVIAPTQDSDNAFLNYTRGFAEGDADDETERWYYANGDGEITHSQIKKINGKYYGFYPEDAGDKSKAGRMLAGLTLMETSASDNSVITAVSDDDVDADDLDDIIDGKNDDAEAGYDLYYFGAKGDTDTDGAMKTGSVTVTLDGESYNFLFQKTGTPSTGKGKGVTGIDDDKYVYMKGVRLKADSDDKYQLVKVVDGGNGTDINADGVTVTKVQTLPAWDGSYTNKDGETVHYAIVDNTDMRLVNTSGNLQKSKSAGVKDGNDCYFYVDKNYVVRLYTDNKVLKTDGNVTLTKADGTTVTTNVSGNNATDLTSKIGVTFAK